MTLNMNIQATRHHQRGATLVVALVMLILLSILAVSSLNIGRSSLQVVHNAQTQAVAADAAQAIINQVVSSPAFTEHPDNVLEQNCPVGVTAPANSRCVFVNAATDSKTVVVVALNPAPKCVQSRALPTNELDLTNPEDLGCTQGFSGQNYGIEGAGALSSLCANSMWEINAQATDPVSNAQAVVTQGVTVRVSTDAAATACPS